MPVLRLPGRAARSAPEVLPLTWILVDSRGIGGIESHIGVLAPALARAGVPVSVVFLADHGPHPLRSALKRAGVPHRTLAGGFGGLWRGLRRGRPGLLHTHGYKAGVLGRLAGRCLGIPVVSTFHAGEPGSLRVRFYIAVDRATARLAHCIAVSDAIRDRLPHGAVLIENFVEMAPAIDGDAGRSMVVAFVGRLSEEKGPDVFCRIAGAFPSVSFHVFGDGPMRAELQQAYGDRVCFHGVVASMAEHWRGIGLLCMPSRFEGMPMAALEALAQGVPVCAFAVGNLPRCVEHGRTGWLAAPGDEAQLEAGVAAWLALDERQSQRMCAAARRMAEQRFSDAAGAERVLEVYARALDRRA